jgi:hypothetical protein
MILVHFGNGGPGLCGYSPPDGKWLEHPEVRWTSDPQEVICPQCQAAMKGRHAKKA